MRRVVLPVVAALLVVAVIAALRWNVEPAPPPPINSGTEGGDGPAETAIVQRQDLGGIPRSRAEPVANGARGGNRGGEPGTARRGDLDPNLVTALDRGAALMGQFEFAQAAVVFEEAAGRFPDSAAAAFDRAVALLNCSAPGSQEQALPVLDQLIAGGWLVGRAQYCAGLALLYLGRPADALLRFQSAALAHPDDAHAAYYLGQTLELADDFAGAVAAYQRAAAIDPFLRSVDLGLQRCALQRGDEAAAAEFLRRFEKSSRNPRSTLAEFKYTRMGALARVLLPEEPPHPTGGGPAFGPLEPLAIENSLAVEWSRAVGAAGITVCDINGDGRRDIFISRALSRGEGNAVILALESGGWRLAADHSLAGVAGVRCVLWGDYDNDGLVDVFLGRDGPDALMRQFPAGVWTDTALLAGVTGPEQLMDGEPPMSPTEAESFAQMAAREELERAGETVDGAFEDFDHDGDLDLLAVYLLARPRLFMNRGDGTFEQLSAAGGFAPERASRLVNLGGRGGSSIYHFSDAGTGCAVADMDDDRDNDIIIVRGERSEVWVNDSLWSWRRDNRYLPIENVPISAVAPFRAAEDGALRLALLIRSQDGSGHAASMQLVEYGPAGMVDLGRREVNGAATIVAADVHGWGTTSLLVGGNRRCLEVYDENGNLTEGYSADALPIRFAPMVGDGAAGPVLVALSGGECSPSIFGVGPGRGNFVTVDFRGRTDPAQSIRSNASGIGTSWAGRVGSWWSTGIARRAGGMSGQSLQPCAIGIGDAAAMDFLSIEWTDGVAQTEVGLKAGEMRSVTETQRQISSCPLIFASNGDPARGGGFDFVTDCLGVGGIGYLAAVERRPDGELAPVYAPPRPHERILLPVGLPVASAGIMEIRLGEPMEEACYLDSARLVAVDVPEELELCLDERMATAAPEPTGEAVIHQPLMTPRRATGNGATDCTAAVSHVDGNPASGSRPDPRFIGRLAEEWLLELEFSEPVGDLAGRALLRIDGWVEYPYGQTTFAMWQAGVSAEPITVEAWDASAGGWKRIAASIGYPAGMTRASLYPLEGLPPDCHRLRLRTTVELYIDRCGVTQPVAGAAPSGQPLPLLTAELAWCGYPQRLARPHKQAAFDYSHRQALWDCRAQFGSYTEYGRCDELVAHTDDALAIFGPGEEIRLRFDASALTAPPPGMRRHFILEVDGWCKDMDRYTGDGQTLDPLPTHTPHATTVDRRHAEFNTRIRAGL